MTEISMWDEQVADVTAEHTAQTKRLAAAAVEPLWPFLSEARTLGEFTSRLSLAGDTFMARLGSVEAQHLATEVSEGLTQRWVMQDGQRIAQQRFEASLRAAVAAEGDYRPGSACPHCGADSAKVKQTAKAGSPLTGVDRYKCDECGGTMSDKSSAKTSSKTAAKPQSISGWGPDLRQVEVTEVKPGDILVTPTAFTSYTTGPRKDGTGTGVSFIVANPEAYVFTVTGNDGTTLTATDADGQTRSEAIPRPDKTVLIKRTASRTAGTGENGQCPQYVEGAQCRLPAGHNPPHEPTHLVGEVSVANPSRTKAASAKVAAKVEWEQPDNGLVTVPDGTLAAVMGYPVDMLVDDGYGDSVAWSGRISDFDRDHVMLITDAGVEEWLDKDRIEKITTHPEPNNAVDPGQMPLFAKRKVAEHGPSRRRSAVLTLLASEGPYLGPADAEGFITSFGPLKDFPAIVRTTNGGETGPVRVDTHGSTYGMDVLWPDGHWSHLLGTRVVSIKPLGDGRTAAAGDNMIERTCTNRRCHDYGTLVDADHEHFPLGKSSASAHDEFLPGGHLGDETPKFEVVVGDEVKGQYGTREDAEDKVDQLQQEGVTGAEIKEMTKTGARKTAEAVIPAGTEIEFGNHRYRSLGVPASTWSGYSYDEGTLFEVLGDGSFGQVTRAFTHKELEVAGITVGAAKTRRQAARDTGTCAECGRGISYDSSKREWYHDNEGSDTEHPAKKSASLEVCPSCEGDTSKDCEACDGKGVKTSAKTAATPDGWTTKYNSYRKVSYDSWCRHCGALPGNPDWFAPCSQSPTGEHDARDEASRTSAVADLLATEAAFFHAPQAPNTSPFKVQNPPLAGEREREVAHHERVRREEQQRVLEEAERSKGAGVGTNEASRRHGEAINERLDGLVQSDDFGGAAPTTPMSTRPRVMPDSGGDDLVDNPTAPMADNPDFAPSDPMRPTVGQRRVARAQRVAERIRRDNPTMPEPQVRALAARVVSTYPEMVRNEGA